MIYSIWSYDVKIMEHLILLQIKASSSKNNILDLFLSSIMFFWISPIGLILISRTMLPVGLVCSNSNLELLTYASF